MVKEVQSKKRNGLLLGIGIGVGALVAAGVICVLAVGGSFFAIIRATEPPDTATATVDYPFTAVVGDVFDITVDTTNTSNETITLSEVWIYDSYLDGIAITGSDPSFSGSEYDDLFVAAWEYYFEIPLEPGASQQIVFEATALRAGDYSGEIEICINGAFRCVEVVMRTVVTPQ